MTLRQKVENNLAIWLLSMLLSGFLAGFAAYQTILEVSGRVTVSEAEYDSMVQAAELVSKHKVEVGPPPPSHHMTVTSALKGDGPTDSLENVRFDEDFWVTTKWIGVTGKNYYNQIWKIYFRDKLVAMDWHPFVPKYDGNHYTWAHFKLDSVVNNPGLYRIDVFINSDKPIDSKIITVDKE